MAQIPPPTRRNYGLRDGRMSAVHFGRVSNPLKLVMLHANGFNGLSYRTILEPLGVHAVALDLRGHGMSELPTDVRALRNWHIFSDDITEFFDRNIERPVVVAGHSYGGVSGILAMPEIKDKVSGYVGFDPVMVPWLFRQVPKLPGGTSYMKKRIPIARNAGRRKHRFDSLEAAFERYHGRGAFRGFTDAALRDYLAGGLVADDGGVKLACDPQWEQAIFTAHGHNVFKAAPALPRDNSHITFAGKFGAVSFKRGRNYLGKLIGADNVVFDKSRAHMFPLQDPDYATARLKEALAKAALRRSPKA